MGQLNLSPKSRILQNYKNYVTEDLPRKNTKNDNSRKNVYSFKYSVTMGFVKQFSL